MDIDLTNRLLCTTMEFESFMQGAVATGVRLGLTEISAEGSTKDGVAKDIDPKSGGVRGVDGLRVGNSKMLDAAWRGGDALVEQVRFVVSMYSQYLV